ncbi:hypothetical protein DVH05_010334 [Phytophthora capsici]|nr:hypothetical protein DVH05_010334 [Phytophthora capsici]
MLYSIRKPTGVADMPQHVKEAKFLTKDFDDKSFVEEMDDGPDADSHEDEGDKQPDFGFEYEGDDDICNTSSSIPPLARISLLLPTITIPTASPMWLPPRLEALAICSN